MRLSALLKRDLTPDPEITGVTADSRKVAAGSLFAALPGVKADGAAFAAGAVSSGAVAVLAGDTIAGEANLGTLRYLLTVLAQNGR